MYPSLFNFLNQLIPLSSNQLSSIFKPYCSVPQVCLSWQTARESFAGTPIQSRYTWLNERKNSRNLFTVQEKRTVIFLCFIRKKNRNLIYVFQEKRTATFFMFNKKKGTTIFLCCTRKKNNNLVLLSLGKILSYSYAKFWTVNKSLNFFRRLGLEPRHPAGHPLRLRQQCHLEEMQSNRSRILLLFCI